MRKISIFTIGLSGLTGLGLIAFVYQLFATDVIKTLSHRTSSFEQQTVIMTRSEAAAAAKREADNKLQERAKLQQGSIVDTAIVNYEILPDMSETADAKSFLMSIRTLGYLGEHATFQRALDQLDTSQILSNMMLLKEDARKLRTVLITPNMLNRQQLELSYDMTQRLLQDLKLMYEQNECSNEQERIMNVALARLTYLTRMFSCELKKYESLTKY